MKYPGYDYTDADLDSVPDNGPFDEPLPDADAPTDTASDTASEPERFTIDSEEKANWLLSKLAGIQAEKARITEQAKKRTAELDADYTRLLGRFSADLEAWARQDAERRRRRSVTLLHGTLAFRTVPASLRVGDPSDALTTAKAVIPTAVQTIEQLDRKAFLDFAKAHFAETGELLPGIERTEGKETFGIS
jgi:phage host-nuclease inhibitor protein Gam